MTPLRLFSAVLCTLCLSASATRLPYNGLLPGRTMLTLDKSHAESGFLRLRGGGGVQYLHTLDEFEAKLKEAKDKLVVVEFTAAWCGPCKRIASKYEEMALENPNTLFYKVDVDENYETATSRSISCMPTFQFFVNGQCMDDVVGADIEKVLEKVKKHARV
uniref:Thioredoxin domain-containing protein n=2 Tax=Guillardia theta (strain CCMP2712) TaxID=905079 RepID=A0A0C3TEV4_GUITC